MHTLKTLLRKYMQGRLNGEELDALRQQVDGMSDQELRSHLGQLWMETSETAAIPEALKQQMLDSINQRIQAQSTRHNPSQPAKDNGQGSEAATQKPKAKVHRIKRMLRIAAVFLCILVGTAMWFNSRVERPKLSGEVMAAIQRAEQSGKNQAVVTIDGQPVSVSSEEAIAKAQAVNTHHSTTASQDRTVTTHHDSEFWMTLEDGTRVHLNYGTQLTYPIHFSGDTREVELQGEAYFFVAKDKSRPFIVHTPNGDVRQYGTEFNINTRDEIGATRVVLVNGSIGITPRGGTESMMRPNDMAILQPGEPEPVISQVDIMPYIAWNTGTFMFDDCTLEQLMRVLGHWYNKRVEFNDDAIREMRFTGEIDKYASTLPTMKAIHKVTGLRIEVRGKEIIISE